MSCGRCVACADRRYGACRTYRASVGGAFGFGPAGGGHGGGLSDLLLVPAADHLLIPAPDGIDPEVLCTLVDNGVDGYRTVAGQLAAAPQADVLVVGGAASSVGLYAVAAAVALGARRVRYVDRDAAQCEAAARLGADAQLQEGPWPRSFERAAVTVENTMEPDGLACTLRSTDDYGYCTSVAIHFAEMTPLPLLHMYTKGITLHLSRADSRRFLPEVINLVASGRLDPSAIPTRVVGWDDAADAWLQPAVKLVVSRSARPQALLDRAGSGQLDEGQEEVVDLPDRRHEVLEVHRLAHVRVRVQLVAAQDVLFGLRGGQHDHGDDGELRVLLQLGEHLEAADRAAG